MKWLTLPFLFVSLTFRSIAGVNDIWITQTNATTGTSQVQTVIPGGPSEILGTNSSSKAAVVGIHELGVAVRTGG